MQGQEQQIMVVVGVPTAHADAIMDAIASAGGGVLGNYTHCGYRLEGTGQFKPDEAASPAVGKKNEVNYVPETRIETFCAASRARAVVQAIRAAHPYEEPVIYLVPLLSEDDLP
ncbi:hypothetical protein [Aggregatilinea lenta]|uniref:hypothetical protein n=1 Tax=Aggregatilinea lenta TaxID=913108 RepID=UPI000E5C0CDD|nr:hypothetical protein [Aggregatilinea lenta]